MHLAIATVNFWPSAWQHGRIGLLTKVKLQRCVCSLSEFCVSNLAVAISNKLKHGTVPG